MILTRIKPPKFKVGRRVINHRFHFRLHTQTTNVTNEFFHYQKILNHIQ